MHASIPVTMPATIYNKCSTTNKFSNKRKQNPVIVAAKKSSGGGGGFGAGAQERTKAQDIIKQQRQQQLAATDLLAKMLRADNNPKRVAEEHIDSLTEEFFTIGSTYLTMAEKDNQEDVYKPLKAALEAAMEVKQSTLRPEIQLLNKLLQADSPLKRKQILNTKESGERLIMNDKYFFGLLERMTNDVKNQPENPQKEGLMEKLAAIKADALDRLPK